LHHSGDMSLKPGHRTRKALPKPMPRYKDEGPGFLSYLMRFLLVLVLLAGLGLVAFAYFGDLAVEPSLQSVPVTPTGE
jgi:hypothetical protein